MLYINFNPDPIIIEKIASLGSPEMLENYINDGKETLPQNTLDALTGVVNAMNSIHDLCYNINQESKGKFRFLVDEFANEEAAALFDRAVSAGYLTAEYQPKGDTASTGLINFPHYLSAKGNSKEPENLCSSIPKLTLLCSLHQMKTNILMLPMVPVVYVRFIKNYLTTAT